MKKKLLALLMSVTMTAALIGCGSAEQTASAEATETTAATEETTEDPAAATESTEAEATEAATETANFSGTISLAGSTSMEKLCEAMSESFMNDNPDYKVTVEYTGSGAGLEALAAGSIDIGNSSRALSDEEKEAGAVENIVALDGIAVITDKENKVGDLTSEQLAAIYTGQITNWKDLGGNDEAIVVLGRESGSGTRDAFEELMEVTDKCEYAQEIDSTGGVLATVASTPGAIGYVSLDVVDDTVNAVKLNGVEASEENILSGDYQLQRPFVMATNGAVEEQSEAVQKWFEYVNSDAGKQIIKDQGLIIPEK